MMDKKIIIGIVVVILILGGFVFWQYSAINNLKTETMQDNEISTDSSDNGSSNSNIQIKTEDIKAGGTNGKGSLFVCADRCGDGVCQKNNSECKDGNLNCICIESYQECPQDCPN